MKKLNILISREIAFEKENFHQSICYSWGTQLNFSSPKTFVKWKQVKATNMILQRPDLQVFSEIVIKYCSKCEEPSFLFLRFKRKRFYGIKSNNIATLCRCQAYISWLFPIHFQPLPRKIDGFILLPCLEGLLSISCKNFK